MNLRAFVPFTVLFIAVSAFPQSANTEINKISAYAGTWKSETEHFDARFSKARRESVMLRNDCWGSDGYFACHQFVDGKPSALIVYTYNRKDEVYKSYIIPSDGGDVTTGKLTN